LQPFQIRKILHIMRLQLLNQLRTDAQEGGQFHLADDQIETLGLNGVLPGGRDLFDKAGCLLASLLIDPPVTFLPVFRL
jgi:hypothetical protein